MEQSREGQGILAACGICAMLVGIYLGTAALTQTGAAFAAAMILLFWLGTALVLLRRPLFRAMDHNLCALVVLFLGLCLRLSLFDHISGDYVSFLSGWVQTMREMTVREALSTPIGDYNMPYLYLLLGISRLPFYDLYCIKLVSVLADVFAALGVAKLTGLATKREGYVLAAFSLAVLAPTAFLNSGYWGQCDSVYAAFCLWGLYFGLNKRPVGSMILLACGFAFKLQTVFLLPMAAFLLVTERVKPRQLLAFPVTFLLVMLPALLAGRSVYDTFSIYFSQASAYPYLSLNAPSAWSLIPNEYYSELSAAPVLAAGTAVVLLLYVFLRRQSRLGTGELLDLALIFTLAVPWLLPKMHERYFYLAEMLSIVYGARSPRRLPVTAVLLGGGFLIYSSYLFGGMPILSNGMVAAIYGATLLYLIVQLLGRTDKNAPIPLTDGEKDAIIF
jgi:Gpi18-like mannosyltransferase